MTISGLRSTTANPLNVTVTGTGGGQTATLALTVFLQDYSLSAAPSGTTVSAGGNAVYTVTVTGTNGFNAPVLLSCPAAYPGIPTGTVCYWNPPAVTLSGTTTPVTQVTSTLTITTETQSKLLRPPPSRFPPGGARWILLLALLTLLFALLVSRRGSAAGICSRRRLAVLMVAIAVLALAVGCDDYYVNPININPVVNGTPSGTYSIVLTGTLGSNNGVIRTTTVNLSVLP